ncbi:WD40/YVTN/BNR-like repeat-containing protein [Duganella hordei]|uniref:WD40/YVTN/BNR-like repeat-containing protein n=1 Tax=Duganella hordei TaxID=2865934 RepID=UPI0030E7624C
MNANTSLISLYLVALALAGPRSVAAADSAPNRPDTITRPALAIGNVGNVALLAIAAAGPRLVAVGERGVIALSDDQGKTWRQSPAPVSVSLTGVRFIDPLQGWAVGHRGIVLHTDDGGLHWTRQLDGKAIAARMERYAQQLEQGPNSDQAQRRSAAAARQMAADGADKPLFDLFFRDPRNGIVIGAYGLALSTDDGGKSWQPIMDRLHNPRGLHLYTIAGAGPRIYIAGEQGTLLRSNDGGARFEAVATPYRGSYFALALRPSGAIVAAGLNGNAYRSPDMGAQWHRIDVASRASFTAFAQDGARLLLANQMGQVFASTDDGATFAAAGAVRAPLSGLADGAGGALTGVGLMGAIAVPAPTQPQ